MIRFRVVRQRNEEAHRIGGTPQQKVYGRAARGGRYTETRARVA